MNEEQSKKTGQAGIPSDISSMSEFEDLSAAFSQLFGVIKKLSDTSDRERAETNARALQAAFESGNKYKAKELIRILEESVGRIQALIAIDRCIGIPDGPV